MNEPEIFAAAIKLSGDARHAFLDLVCGQDARLRGQIEALLRAHDESGGLLPKISDSDRDETQILPCQPATGVVIAGRYKLLEQIGEGGMGTVWVAEQSQPVKRKVALKLIKAGMDSKNVLARFGAERQALALMEHPNIAKVLDGGVTEQGRPYFIMEYIRGIPITEYCDSRKLSIHGRLELFEQVCQAVQHAHQKGIIHRDLKPSNILVAPYDDKPVPKVIDFGLAKALHQSLTENTLHTAHDMVLGTPLYMSPEQAQLNNLDIDTRSDIYSLGVLLHELLTGRPALEKERFRRATWEEQRRLICEAETPRPSQSIATDRAWSAMASLRSTQPKRLMAMLQRELDWVVLKCLEKQRDRRYETASDLARDVRLYLDDQPVEARPPTMHYRMRKFVRRNKGVVLASSLGLLLLVGGIAGTAWGLAQAKAASEKERAAQELAENYQSINNWISLHARFAQIKSWLSDSPNYFPSGGATQRERLGLNVNDRDRLYRAMVGDVLTEVELAPSLPLAPEMGFALLVEVAVRNLVAGCLAESDQPAAGIPHLERAIEVLGYLGSPPSQLTTEGKSAQRHTACMAQVQLLDLQERAGMIELAERTLVRAERELEEIGEMRGEGQALAGIHGALLGRRGDFATGEVLLLARYNALTSNDGSATEFLPGELTATARRLKNLYSSWNRLDEAAKWQQKLEALTNAVYRRKNE